MKNLGAKLIGWLIATVGVWINDYKLFAIAMAAVVIFSLEAIELSIKEKK